MENNSMVDEKYIQYPKDVLSGKIVACEYVKQACKRYLDWFDREDLEFRSDKVDKVVTFISNLKHSTDSHAGKHFILLPYQFFIVSHIFGWYYKGTNDRVTKSVYIELARKSGKTALVAAILLYVLVGEGKSGVEVDLVANNAKQARICFTQSSNFLESIDKKGKYFKRYRDSIKFDKTKSFLQVLSSEANGLDGFNSSAFCLDEAHAMKNDELWSVLKSSQGMRTNPLAIIITTAGFDKNGFCYPYRATCLEILSGIKQNDSQFAVVYTLDEGDDYADPKVWIKANPSLGVTVKEEYLRGEVLNAKNTPSLETSVKTKNFNIWCDSSTTWIPSDYILKATEEVRLAQFPKDTTAYCGVDLSSVSDLTALSFMIPYNGKFYFKNYYYLPKDTIGISPNSEVYKAAMRRKDLIVTPGNVVDYEAVIKTINDSQEHLFIDKIAYDSWNATQFAITCTEMGLPLEPFSQSLGNFNKPTKEFERLIRSGKVVIDNSELTRFCFKNVELQFDHNDNVKPSKVNYENKIDGVIAMVQALGIYLDNPYSNQEIITL